jgi:tRNA1(Val) A37 N6-methylase TrmN6
MNLPNNFSVDELPWGQVKLVQNPDNFCYGIDAVLLADFARCKKNSRCVDLCSGNGAVAFLMAAKYPSIKISTLEIQKELSLLADISVELNSFKNRISVYNGDLKNCLNFFEKNTFNCVTVNPPYMTGQIPKNEKKGLAIARHEICCNLEDVLSASDALLNSSGDFYMIHRANRLDDIFSACEKTHINVKEIRLVYPSENKDATMVLVHGKKSALKGMSVLPALTVYDRTGVYSEEVQKIYSSC